MSSSKNTMQPSPATLRTPIALATASLFVFGAGISVAAVDLAAIRVLPDRGQTVDQTRRDRYECHNWTLEQTGVAPAVYDPAGEARAERGSRIAKVLLGAGIGAAVGGIVGSDDDDHRRGRRYDDDDDALEGALGGAALGAAVGALIGRRAKRNREEEAQPAEDPYLRALTACLEGRGYVVIYTPAD